MMKKFLILLLTVLGIIVFLASPIMNVRYVHIYGNNAVSTSTILNTIQEPSHIISYSSRRAEEILVNSLPHIYRANVNRNLFSRELIIEIVEKKVIAYVLFSEEQYLHIDIEGTVLATSTYTSPNLPIITGLNFTNFGLDERLDISDESLYVLAQFATFFTAYDVTGVTVNTEDINNLRLYYGNILVNLGNNIDLDTKIRAFIAAIPSVSHFRNIGGTLHIDDINGQWRFELLS